MATKAQKQAAAKAALLKELEEKYNSLPETATDEEKADLSAKIAELKAEIEKDGGKVKVKFLKSPTASPFYLGYNQGETVEIDALQAAELIHAEIAVEVK